MRYYFGVIAFLFLRFCQQMNYCCVPFFAVAVAVDVCVVDCLVLERQSSKVLSLLGDCHSQFNGMGLVTASIFIFALLHEHTHYAWIDLQEMGCSPTQKIVLSLFRSRFSPISCIHIWFVICVCMSLTLMCNSNVKEHWTHMYDSDDSDAIVLIAQCFNVNRICYWIWNTINFCLLFISELKKKKQKEKHTTVHCLAGCALYIRFFR